jgi:hypothetical protein
MMIRVLDTTLVEATQGAKIDPHPHAATMPARQTMHTVRFIAYPYQICDFECFVPRMICSSATTLLVFSLPSFSWSPRYWAHSKSSFSRSQIYW